MSEGYRRIKKSPGEPSGEKRKFPWQLGLIALSTGALGHTMANSLDKAQKQVEEAERLDKKDTRKFELLPAFKETLTLAQQDYAKGIASRDKTFKKKDGSFMTLEEFYEKNDIPSADDVESLERLMRGLQKPVQFYWGTETSFRDLMTNSGKEPLDSRGYYHHSKLTDTHEIFIFTEEVIKDPQKKEAEKKYLSKQDLNVIVSEIAHALQTEEGRPYEEHDNWETLEQQRALYGTPGTREHNAHSEKEQILHKIRDELSYFEHELDIQRLHEALVVLHIKDPEKFIAGDFTFNDFFSFINAVEYAYNNPRASAKERAVARNAVNMLHLLPGFGATYSWQIPGEPPVIKGFPVNTTLYEAFKASLSPDMPTKEKLYEQVARISASTAVQETERAENFSKGNTYIGGTYGETQYDYPTYEYYTDNFSSTVNRVLGRDFGELTRGRFDKLLRAMSMYEQGKRSTSPAINEDIKFLISMRSSLEREFPGGTITDDNLYSRFHTLYTRSKTSRD